jgi:sugar O-acyltransferase (sialic acid O-acetyltransferase NeuD family)
MRQKIILVGAGGHAKSCIDVIERTGKFQIRGIVATLDEIGKKVLGYEVIADETGLPELRRKFHNLHIAIGQIKSAENRVRLFDNALSMNFNLPAIISPLAHISCHAIIDIGSVIMHQVIVNAAARVGKNCIINTKSMIEHDCQIGDYCHISTGAIVNGGVTVGDRTFIGSGSVIKEGLSIGANCLISMGSRVFHDLPAGTIFNGKQ